jgi:chromate transporter
MIDKKERSPDAAAGSAGEVLIAFLRLGCTSFGGPIAHLGYFRSEFVERRKWCTEETFAELLALAQSMPGPASSQVGFALGLLRARLAGGFAAWVGFTTPSALLMLAFAFGHKFLTGKLGAGVVHGLQLAAVAVVAQAILAMQKSLAPDLLRMALALIATTIALFAPASFGTVLAIGVGALLGRLPLRSGPSIAAPQVRFERESAQGLPSHRERFVEARSERSHPRSDRSAPRGTRHQTRQYRRAESR